MKRVVGIENKSARLTKKKFRIISFEPRIPKEARMGAVLVEAVCCSAGEKVGLRGLTNAIIALPRP